MQRDAAARSGDHLRDPAAHLAGADDEYVLELHGGGAYPSHDGGPTAQHRRRGGDRARSAYAAGRRPTGTSFRPQSSTAAVSIEADAGAAPVRAAGRVVDVRRRGRRRAWSASPPSARAVTRTGSASSTRSTSTRTAWSTGTGRALIEQRGGATAPSIRRGDALGARGQPARPRFYERAGWSVRRGAARRRRAGASRAPEVRYRKRFA